MNKERRDTLATAAELIQQAEDIVREAAQEEQDYYDNMPEGIQMGEKGDRAEEVVSALEEVADALTEARDSIQEAAE